MFPVILFFLIYSCDTIKQNYKIVEAMVTAIRVEHLKKKADYSIW